MITHGFIPTIINTCYQKDDAGTIEGTVLFFDISGFTRLTSDLMVHGKNGAEVLSNILNEIFGLVVDVVYSEKGFITTFAGDAATAVFAAPFEKNVYRAAAKINRIFDDNHLQRTPFGDFALDVKMGIDAGKVEWRIICNKKRCTYYFRGSPVDGAAEAESHASSREIIATDRVGEFPEDFSAKKISAFNDFKLIYQTKDFQPIRRDSLKKELESDYKAASESSEQFFYPVNRFLHLKGGEFREITSVFLSFPDTESHEELDDIIENVLSSADDFGGYFNMVDFGDKGGVILVLFGAPTSHENDLHRGVSFAEEVTRILGKRIRAGISTGTAYAGIVGGTMRKTYTALGSVVNLSARLAMEARWGAVELSGQSAQNLSKDYSFESLDERSVKGFTKPVAVYRLVSRREDARDYIGEETFVGRDNEKKLLTDWLSLIPAGNQGIFYIYGQPGTGKSFLVDSILKEHVGELQVIRLYTDAILRKSLSPFVPAVMKILKINDSFSYTRYKDAVSKFLRKYRNMDTDLINDFNRSSPTLASLAGIPVEDEAWARLDPQGRFEMLRSALTRLFFILSLDMPVLIVVEDAHALDDDSKAVFDRVTAGSEYRLAILALSREGEEQDRPRITTQDPVDERNIILGPLTRDNAESMAMRLLGGEIDSNLLDFIELKSGLNPLFLKELTSHLRDNRYIVSRNGTFFLARDEIDMPRTLSSIMVSRIDSLPEGLKDLILTASVIGQEFDPDVVKDLMDTDDTERFLLEGVNAGIFIILSEGRYFFRQPVLQETAYSMQFESALKSIHGKIARVIQKRHHDDPRHYADQAYHFEKAGIVDETKRALEKAIDYAMGTYRNQKALEFINRFFVLEDDEFSRIRLLRHKGDIYELTGNWDKAIESLIYGLGISVVGKLVREQSSLLARLGTIYQKQGNSAKAVAVLEQAIAQATEMNDSEILSESYVSLGRARWSTGDYKQAFKALGNATKHSRKAGDREMEALSYYYEGVVFRDTTRYDDAVDRYQVSLDIFNTLENDRLATYPMYDLAVVYQYQGRLEESWDYFMKSADVYERIGYESGLSAALLNLGVLKDRRGEFDEAIEYFGRARQIAERMGEELAIAYTIFSLGATYYKTGDYRKGVEYLKEAYTLMKRINAYGYFGYALSYLASLYASRGDTEFALRTAYLHVENIKKIGSDVENGRTFLAVAMILEKEPELNEDLRKRLKTIADFAGIKKINAENFFKKAIEVSKNAHFINTLIPAEHNYGKYLIDRNRTDAGKKQLQKALALAESSGWNLMVEAIQNELSQM